MTRGRVQVRCPWPSPKHRQRVVGTRVLPSDAPGQPRHGMRLRAVTWISIIHCTLPVWTGTRRKIRMTTYQEANAVAGSTQEVTKVKYTAKTHTSGGRRGGVSRSDDGRLEVNFSAPGVPGTGTNPEQLFAAGWSACFISAMGLVANKLKVKLPSDV